MMGSFPDLMLANVNFIPLIRNLADRKLKQSNDEGQVRISEVAYEPFYVVQNHGSSRVASDGYAPFYERNSDHFIESHQQ